MQKILFVAFFMVLVNCAYSQKVRVVEKSGLAKLAGKIKKERKYAVTFGNTIFINCRKDQFFADTSWMKHELIHVQQYQKHGIFGFLTLYFVNSIFHNYSENPFEKEALSAEFSDERLGNIVRFKGKKSMLFLVKQ